MLNGWYYCYRNYKESNEQKNNTAYCEKDICESLNKPAAYFYFNTAMGAAGSFIAYFLAAFFTFYNSHDTLTYF